MRRSGVGALALLAVVGASPAHANLPKDIGQRTMSAVVFLLAADEQDGKLVPVVSGSGTILTADGLILTNRHVIFDEEKHHFHGAVAIGLLRSYDQAPDLVCLAAPSHALIDAKVDLAVIKCETDLSGKPYTPHDWPTVPLGRSEDLVPGSSEVYVVGYPGVGGATINVTRGTVSGFLGADGGPGRFWVKTDAAIGHGNSGGTAIDEDGKLIGVPTAFKPSQSDDNEHVGLIRPVELARPLIARATSGEWKPEDGPPEGGGISSDSFKLPVPNRVPTPAPKKGWHEESSCAVASGTVVVGHIVASDNGSAVEGAYVVILKQGVKRKQVDDTFANIDDLTLTYAVSDQDGAFAMGCPVPRDQRFTVIAVAKGFRELSADEILDTSGAPDRFPAWGGKILLQRK